MSNASPTMAMHNTSNLQKELLAMSVAAAASMNATGKESIAPPNKSRKSKTPARSSGSYSNSKPSQQPVQSTSRAKDASLYDSGNFINSQLKYSHD